MNLYAESSAVLAWLLGESPGKDVVAALGAAGGVVTSDLTEIECQRTLIRATRMRLLREASAADRRAALRAALRTWNRLGIHHEIVDRARGGFPVEPVRSLDAIHLASALVARSEIPGLVMLSLDERIRNNARELGFEVIPG